MSQKAKISITIDNVMHLALTIGAIANNNIAGLHTIPPHNLFFSSIAITIQFEWL